MNAVSFVVLIGALVLIDVALANYQAAVVTAWCGLVVLAFEARRR